MFREFKFEGVWGKLEANTCFQRQPFIKYFRLTLVFMRVNKLRENSNFCQEVFANINKIFILTGRLGTSLSFCEV